MLIVKLRIDSFIVTLSMMFIFMGLRSGISGGQPYPVPTSFGIVGQKGILGGDYIYADPARTDRNEGQSLLYECLYRNSHPADHRH